MDISKLHDEAICFCLGCWMPKLTVRQNFLKHFLENLMVLRLFQMQLLQNIQEVDMLGHLKTVLSQVIIG